MIIDEVATRMDYERLSEVDPGKEIEGWFKQMQDMIAR